VASYATALGTTDLSYTTTAAGGIQTQITDALGNVTTLVHDAQGRLIDTQNPSGTGLIETQYQYDSNGNVTQSTKDPTGSPNVTAFQYDSHGNLILTRDADGNTVTRTYSSTNQLLTETSYVTPDPDGAGPGQPDLPLTARYAYDSVGHLRFQISADGRVTEYRYDSAGDLVSKIEYAGGEIDVSALTATTALTEAQLVSWVATQDLTKLQRADYTYDFRGQVSKATAYASTDSSGAGVAAGASSTQFVHDQRGRLLQTIDPRGIGSATNPADTTVPYSTTYIYDGLGRVTSQTAWTAAGSTTTTTTQYDDVGGRTVVTYANGLVSTSTYNLANELISSTNVGPRSQALGTTTYTYDADGRLRMVIDANGNKSYVLYDASGRKVADIDADGELTEYVYDNESHPLICVHTRDPRRLVWKRHERFAGDIEEHDWSAIGS
jgi:YD repeat-containing protein